jgi:peptide/nickel transport system permease protein
VIWAYALKRLLLGVATVFGIISLIFLLELFLPKSDNPYERLLFLRGQSAAQKQALREHYGLDEPLLLRYEKYIENVSRPLWTWVGIPPRIPQPPDLGESLQLQIPVSQAIASRAGATAELMITSYLLVVVVSIPSGIISAVRRGGKLDQTLTGFSFIGVSLPNFWFGILLIYAFAVYPHLLGIGEILPAGGRHSPGVDSGVLDLAWHLVLPATVLAVQSIASYSRYTRGAMLDALGEDYIRTARAKGLSERRVILRHALRNSMLPFITLAGLDIPSLFAGAVVTEYVFDWPGMGQLFVISAQSNDVPILLGTTLILSVLVVLGNLIADLLYTWADPRITYEHAR